MSEANDVQKNNKKSKVEFRNTYLYVKTHNVTGLKYFGKTVKKDPFKYKGSGTRWLRHLKVHGIDVSTEIVGYFENEEECVSFAKRFSEENNVIADQGWANLREENGVDGGFLGEESRKKIRDKQIKRVAEGTHQFLGPEMNKRSIANGTNPFAKGDEVRERIKNKTHLFLNKEWQKEAHSKLKESGKHNFLGGKIQREMVLKGTHPFLDGEMQRRNIIERIKNGTHPTQIKKVCPHCNKETNLSFFAVAHGEKCIMKDSTQISFL